MSEPFGLLFGSLGTMSFFALIAFCVWIDYRKKKDERDAAHQERMKALEMGIPLLDAEIERAKSYASAAWAAGLIGLLVPLVVMSLATGATLAVVLGRHRFDNLLAGLIVAWSIAGVISLVTILRSLGVIRQLPRPNGETAARAPILDKRLGTSSTEFQGKRLEL